MLTLYHAAMSPCAQKVRLVLHEKGLTYESVIINLSTKENLEPAYLRLNPNGVVPTLVEDELPVIESTIICEYLDDRFQAESLRPPAAAARAKMRLWMKRVDEYIHPASGVLLFSGFMRQAFLKQTSEVRAEMLGKMPDKARRARQEDLIANGFNSALVPGAIAVFQKMIDDIEAVISNAPWIVGEALSLADFALTPYVSVIENFGLERIFAKRPAMADWFHRVKQTEGYLGGIAAYLPVRQAAGRAAMLAEITPRLDMLFADAGI